MGIDVKHRSNFETCYNISIGKHVVRNVVTGETFHACTREEAYTKAREAESLTEGTPSRDKKGNYSNQEAYEKDTSPITINQPERFEAHREPVSFRYDLIDANFLHALALLKGYGAKKYGDTNFMDGLPGSKSPANHIMGHLHQYRTGQAYDHTEIGGDSPKFHLIAIAINAMMEWQLQEKLDNEKGKK